MCESEPTREPSLYTHYTVTDLTQSVWALRLTHRLPSNRALYMGGGWGSGRGEHVRAERRV